MLSLALFLFSLGLAASQPAREGSGDKLEPVAATLSSTYDEHPSWNNFGSFGAAHCIDGNRGGPEIVDNVALFCHTKSEPAPWLAIDYGTRVTVQRVEIFTRNGCCGERTRNVDVRIADELPTSGSEMFHGGTLLGHYPGPATHGQLITISGQETSGRYVIVQMDNGEDELNLKEVTAFGTAAPGPGTCQCGVKGGADNNRIVGGQETEEHEYPWQVHLVVWEMLGNIFFRWDL